MTSPPAAAYVVVDTNVLSFLIAASPLADGYLALLADRRIALAPAVVAELLDWASARALGARRRGAIEALRLNSLQLPWAAPATYARVNQARRQHRNGSSTHDVWIIASAWEYGLPFMTHDGQAALLAETVGVPRLTLL